MSTVSFAESNGGIPKFVVYWISGDHPTAKGFDTLEQAIFFSDALMVKEYTGELYRGRHVYRVAIS